MAPGAGEALLVAAEGEEDDDDVAATVDETGGWAPDRVPVLESVWRKTKQFWQTRTGLRMRRREISDSKREQLRQKTKPQLRQ